MVPETVWIRHGNARIGGGSHKCHDLSDNYMHFPSAEANSQKLPRTESENCAWLALSHTQKPIVVDRRRTSQFAWNTGRTSSRRAARFKSQPHKAYFTNSSRNSQRGDHGRRTKPTGGQLEPAPITTAPRWKHFRCLYQASDKRRNRPSLRIAILNRWWEDGSVKEAARSVRGDIGISGISFCTPAFDEGRAG